MLAATPLFLKFKSLNKPQIKVYLMFFLYSLVLGGIYPRLGDLQIKMEIGEGALGAALLGAALGTQISLMLSASLIDKIGFRSVLLFGIPMLGVAFTAATMASGPFLFFFFLMIGGLAIGAVEIVINLEADRTEKLIGRRIMNRSHAFWSFGFFTAGIIGAIASEMAIDPTYHLMSLVFVSTILLYVVFKNFMPAPGRVKEEEVQSFIVRPTKSIMIIVVFTLSAMLLEGAGADWSVIFMRDTFDVSPLINGLALTLGALSQALTRFFADGIIDKHGPSKVAKTSVIILGVSLMLVTFSIHPSMALLGFALMGVGTSCIFPLAMSATAQRTDRPSATNVAAFAQLSFLTFLIAPPLLGVIAEVSSIRYSFGIAIPLVVLSYMTVSCVVPNSNDKH